MEKISSHQDALIVEDSILFRRNYSRSFTEGTLKSIFSSGCVLSCDIKNSALIHEGDKLQLLFQWEGFQRAITAHVKEKNFNSYRLFFELPLQKDRKAIEIYIDSVKKQKSEDRQDFQKILKDLFL